MSGLPELELLAGQNLLSSLDVYFAELMGRLATDNSIELSMAAALTSNAVSKGHVCLPLDSQAGSRLGNPVVCALPERDEWQRRLRNCGVVGAPGDFAPLILDNRGRLYLQRYWQYEQSIASELLRRAAIPTEVLHEPQLKQAMDQLFSDSIAATPDWQKLAVATAVLKNFTLISGGPGTGKTSIVVRILALLQQQAEGVLDIVLTAPTGKAAARLQASIRQAKLRLPLSEDILSAIPERAATIHRLLGSRPDSKQYRYHAGNQLPVDALVMDEASMVDVALMSRLLQALPEKCRLILLGDRHQLASVEAGSVLGDIYGNASGFTPQFQQQLERVTGEILEASKATDSALNDSVVTLRHSYRFGKESGIGKLASAVNLGDGEAALRQLRDPQSTDVKLLDRREDLISLALTGYKDFLQLARDGGSADEVFKAFERFRMLTALSVGPYGTQMLNQAIEQALTAIGVAGDASAWYPGRPVIVRRNDYNLRLYNGDIGIYLKDELGQPRVCFPDADGLFRWIAPSRLPQHDPAYVMTVHKSQGSEFERVLMVLPENDTALLTRELIYTAVTRARERFEISANDAVLRLAVTRRLQRSSGLRDALWEDDNG